jgi:pimeloyl-ACP methyl ester carboxylesterase
MDLFFRKFGEGTPLIIVHGLYGSSDNWLSIGKELGKNFEVYLIDQRNHGNSPHSREHNYILMKNDLLDFMDKNSIRKAHLIGHSMGGKTIMFFAADYPERIISLVVVDMSPLSYKRLDDHSPNSVEQLNIVTALMNVDLSKANTRGDIENMLIDSIKSKRIRQFLMKNIQRKSQNEFEWKININALYDSMPDILDGLDPEKFKNGKGIKGFPVLFVKGESSNYLSEMDFPLIKTIFPDAEIVTIPGAGHWVHAEQPEEFLEKIKLWVS